MVHFNTKVGGGDGWAFRSEVLVIICPALARYLHAEKAMRCVRTCMRSQQLHHRRELKIGTQDTTGYLTYHMNHLHWSNALSSALFSRHAAVLCTATCSSMVESPATCIAVQALSGCNGFKQAGSAV